MGWVTRITDWWWIMKNDQKSLEIITDKYRAEAFIKNSSRIAKLYRKKSTFRNAIAWHQRDIRKKYPYKVQDYSIAKALYEQYWMIPSAIKSIEELKMRLLKAVLSKKRVFIHYFRFEYPVKSEGYERYHINGSGGGKLTTFELRLHDTDSLLKGGERIIQARTFKGNWEKFYIESDPQRITQYLWADQDQINRFEERAIQFSFLQGEKAKAMEEVRKIEKEIQAV